MRSFDIPTHYRSNLIGRLKAWRKAQDPKKKDLSPTVLDLGPVRFVFARHFGFCYGVENAIEISYKALEPHFALPWKNPRTAIGHRYRIGEGDITDVVVEGCAPAWR